MADLTEENDASTGSFDDGEIGVGAEKENFADAYASADGAASARAENTPVPSEAPENADAAEQRAKDEKNPFAFAEGKFHGEVVTEAVVYEKKLPRSSEKSATFEADTPENADGAAEGGDEYIAGGKPVIYYHLSDYDGPLDLLLELIKDAKIKIEEIFVSDVTRQYVEIIKNTPKEELDFEYAGEFITLAAELVYLKSLRTLPAEDDEDEYYDDPEIQRAALINKIKEYALMKEQSEKLRGLETINRFYRPPVYTEKDYRVCLTNFSLSKLVTAFARVMVNADRRERSVIPKKVMQDKFSVADQMRHIIEKIAAYGSFTFTSLFEPDYDRNDIVTTFLAVLELLKYGRLHAVQEEMFGEIMLYEVEGASGLPLSFEEEDDGKY